jgi:hypothetical protein
MVRQPARAFETVAVGKFLSVDRPVDAGPQMYQGAVARPFKHMVGFSLMAFDF